MNLKKAKALRRFARIALQPSTTRRLSEKTTGVKHTYSEGGRISSRFWAVLVNAEGTQRAIYQELKHYRIGMA